MPKETLDLIIPAEGGFNIIPNDVTDLEPIARAIYIGTSGTLRVRMVNGSDVSFGNILAGIVHPLRVVRVFATGTTATDIRGLN